MVALALTFHSCKTAPHTVFVWRLCSPAIRQQVAPDSHPVRLASRSTGIGLLVGFNVLWLLTMWSYARVCMTPPGFVNDYAKKEPEPHPIQQMWMEKGEGGPYLGPQESEDGSSAANGAVEQHTTNGHAGPKTTTGADAFASHTAKPSFANDQQQDSWSNGAGTHHGDELPIDPSLPAFLGPAGAGLVAADAEGIDDEPARGNEQHQTGFDSGTTAATQNDDDLNRHERERQAYPSTQLQKIPKPLRLPPSPDYAPLAPCNLYCWRCEIVKTYRAHHCRHCGRCVMKMDHHCPWVGGCVGARNHKFFHHFLLWVTALEIYVVVSIAVLFARGAQSRPGYQQWTIDGFVISLFPICLFFFLFTFSLLVTHTWLMVTNQTTIEHLAVGRTKRKEDMLLYGYFSDRGQGGKGMHIKEKRQIRQEWDRQWGRLRWELNLWKVERRRPGAKGSGNDEEGPYERLGPLRARLENWKQTMGDSPILWFFPLGGPLSDGRYYEPNPRHGPYGEWRQRQAWPEELR